MQYPTLHYFTFIYDRLFNNKRISNLHTGTCCRYFTCVLWITRSNQTPTIYTWSATIDYPPHVIHNIYVGIHNVHPQPILLHMLWVCVVGSHVYIVDHTFESDSHNIYMIIHNTYSTGYMLSPKIRYPHFVAHTIYPCPPQYVAHHM